MVFQGLFKDKETLGDTALRAEPVGFFNEIHCVILGMLVVWVSENESFFVCKERPDTLKGILVCYGFIQIYHVEPIGSVALGNPAEYKIISDRCSLSFISSLSFSNLVLCLLHICIMNILSMYN
jgi:hypothetical protein